MMVDRPGDEPLKKGNTHGPRAGDRHIWMRLRVSAEEREHLHRTCDANGQTVSRRIRIVLKENGLLPSNSKT